MARALIVEIIGDSSSLEKSLNKSAAAATTFGAKMEKVGGSMVSFGKNMTKSVTLPVVALGAVMVKTAMDGEKSSARLDTAFKNVGVSVAGAAKSVDAMQTSGNALGFTNNQIRQSIGSLVTSTGSLSKAHRELGIAEDLARFKGVSLEQGTKALTMANAGSMRALKQLGITIIPVTNAVDALKASHMKLTTEQGRAALAAAKLIDKQATNAEMLKIVSGLVKGQGKAYADTAAGGMAVFRAKMDALSEKLGTAMLPLLNRLVDWLSRALGWFERLSPSTQKWIMIVAGGAALMGPTVAMIGNLTKAIGLLDLAIEANPIVLLISAIVLLGGAMAAATFAPKQFEAVLEKVGVSAADAGRVIMGLQLAFQVFSAVVNAALFSFRTAFQTVFMSIGPAISLVTDMIHGRWGPAWNDFKALALAPIRALWASFTAIFPQFPQVVSAAWNAIKSATASAWGSVVSVVRSHQRLILAILTVGASEIVPVAARIGRGIVNGITSVLHTIGGKVKGALDAIWGVISRVASLAFNAAIAIGAELIHGIIAGIGHALGGAVSAVVGAAKSLVHAGLSALGIGSPSKVTAKEIGEPFMQGIGLGIQNATANVATQIVNSINAIMRAAVTAARQEIAKAKADMNTAMGTLGGNVISAAGSLGPAFGAPKTRALGKKLTAEQAAQAAQQAKAQQDQLDKAILDARTKQSSDIAAGADSATLAADQAAIDQAVQANADYQQQKQIDADAKALAEQQKRDKDNLEKQFAALQTELKAHPERAAKIKKEIDDLLKKFGITPASVTAATDWQTSQSLFVGAIGDLKGSMDALTKATLDLAGAQAAAASPGGGGMPHLATGGPVPIMAHSGEYVIRAGSAAKLGGRVLGYMNQTGRLPRFDDGGIISLPPKKPKAPINPTTGTQDDPAYRAAAMYLNDYGYDRNQVEIGTALAGLLGPRAQAQAAMRATYVNTPNGKVQLRHGLWRGTGGVVDSKMLDAWKGQFPGITFEGGTPGQQISWMQAASRLPMGGQELGSLIASSVGASGTGANTHGSLLEQLTSHAVHFAGGGIVTRPTFAMVGERGPEAIVPLGGRRAGQTTIVMQVDGRTLGKVALDYAHEQQRWGGPVKVTP